MDAHLRFAVNRLAGPPVGPTVDSERWDIVPAQIGSGTWLVASGTGETCIWAPPGVALTGEHDEALERWTYAESRSNMVEQRTLPQVIGSIPADFEQWAIDATTDQVRMLGLYASSASDADPYAEAARAVRAELADQLLAVARPRLPRQADIAAGFCDAVYSSLTDIDFHFLVRGLMGAFLKRPLAAWSERVKMGVDTLFAELDGARHLVQIEHHGCDTGKDLIGHVRHHAMSLRLCDADFHWLVTPYTLDGDSRQELLRAVSPWVTERHNVLCARDLDQLIEANPSVVRDQVKLRAARAAQRGLSPTLPNLSSMAETQVVAHARERLQATGAVVIIGPPGSGKTSMLSMLVADAALDDYEPAPAFAAGRPSQPSRRRVVFCDDVRSAGVARSLVAEARDEDVLVVLACAPELAQAFPEHAIDIGGYGPRDRALVYYNHVWNARHLHPEARAALAEPAAYGAVIEHPAFTPRLAHDVAQQGPQALDQLPRRAPKSLDDPHLDGLFVRIRTCRR